MENDNTNNTKNSQVIPQPEKACETLDQVIKSRRKYRSLLFHVLYAVDALDYDVNASEIAAKLNHEYETDIDVNGSIVSIVNSIATQQKELDATFVPFLENWTVSRIGKCTLLVLRYAIWEMKNTETSHNIVINEAIELAKCFSEKDAYKFVNGILDKISSALQKEKEEDNLETVESETETK